MLITTLLLATMAPLPSAMVDTSRVAFTTCLRQHMKKSLEAKMPEAEYDMALKSACDSERTAFHKAVVALNTASGDSPGDAAENADMQVDDYHASFADKFADYSTSGTLPAD